MGDAVKGRKLGGKKAACFAGLGRCSEEADEGQPVVIFEGA